MREKTEVLYNASCPICSREVDHYAKLTEKGALPIRYDDLADATRLAQWGVTAEEAARRLHVRKEGRIHAGLPAFIVLWREIPQTRWLARVFSMPGLHWLAARIYDAVLAPLLYALHRRRQARK